MRHFILAGAGPLILATRLVSAADMFLTITPHPGPLAPVYNTTSSTSAPTTMNTIVTTAQSSEPLPSVTHIQPECTWGLTNQCMPIYITTPHSADASTLAMAKSIENALWFIASGGSVLLLCTGKVEAVALLLILTVAEAQGQNVPSHTSVNTVTSTTMPTTSALPSTDLIIWDPATTVAPNATIPEHKLYCGVITNGTFYASTCPAGLNTMIPSPTVPEDKLSCYAPINGLLYPSTCPDGFNPPASSPPFQPGECAAHTVFNLDVTVLITLWHFWLPFLAWHIGLISEDVLTLVWLCAALNSRVLASQAMSTAPAMTSTVTVYRATPLDQVQISETVTASQAFTARKEMDGSAIAPEAPAEPSTSANNMMWSADVRAVDPDTCPTLYGITDCPSLYDLQNCPLPHAAPVSSSGAAASLAWPTVFSTILAALTLARVTGYKTGLALGLLLLFATTAQAEA